MINYRVKENNNIEYNNDTTIIWSCEKVKQRSIQIKNNNLLWHSSNPCQMFLMTTEHSEY